SPNKGTWSGRVSLLRDHGAVVERLCESLQRRVRRPALLHGLPAHGLHTRGLLPRPPPLLAVGVHQGPHSALELRGHHEVAPFPVHLERHGHAHVGHQLKRVQVLLRVQRPRRHGHAVPQALQHRVPAAVRHEAAHGGVRQDLLLRRPRRPHQALAPRPLQEPLREQLVEVRVRRVLRPGRVRGWSPQDPQEAVAAPLERGSDLRNLRRVEPPHAPETEERNGPRRLRVQPRDALVRRRAAAERQHGADRVHRRRGPAGHAPAPGDGRQGPRLELVRCVGDDPRGVHEAVAEAHEARVVGAPLVRHGARHGVRRHRRQPRQRHVPLHLVEVHGGDGLVEHGQVQHEREHGPRGRHEDVGRHPEAPRHVHQRRGEEVEHERGHGARHGGHGVTDVRRVEADVARDELLDPDGVGGGLHGGEAVEADVQPARGLAPHVRLHLGGGLGRRRAHHEQGDGEGLAAAAAEEDALTGLEHGHEVAGPPLR
uniref:Uncharacterized protein n=1 Tax=Zea mays TaxID=4577 RepID=A0A804QGB2_MAIZE